jgi:hypothetical protein
MKPYNLTLFAMNKPATPTEIWVSVHMIAFGLWDEFSKLPHVTLQYVNSDGNPEIPDTDFSLIHAYFNSTVYNRLPEIKAHTHRHVMGIMESVFESPLIDHVFTFLPMPHPHAEQIRLPVLGSLLQQTPKTLGSVLLDHGWPDNAGKSSDWLPRLYNWLDPISASAIGQLCRSGYEDHMPSWVTPIPETNYLAYLKATDSYETFIMTHPGSYEHSIIDMAARETRVLVPRHNGRPFCHQSIIDDLKLDTFADCDELRKLLASPLAGQPTPAAFTDMPEVVARIDAYCQEAMP